MPKWLSLSVGALFLLSGCSGASSSDSSSTGNATVVSAPNSTYQFPAPNNISRLEAADDSADQMVMVPLHEAKTLPKVLVMLQSAKMVTVDIPKWGSKKELRSAGYNGPASLLIYTNDNKILQITPLQYIYVDKFGNISSHDVVNVLSCYDSRTMTTVYFEDKAMYDWLKNDQWKQEFQPKH